MSKPGTRPPSLGQIAAASPELDYFIGGGAMHYNRTLSRIESVTSIRHLCLAYPMRLTLSGASVAYTNLIPAGVVLLGGVTAKNWTAVTGVTSYQVGTVEAPTLFASAASIAAGAETDYADQIWTNVIRSPVATTVYVTAVGGTFSGGLVELTAWGLPH